MYDRASESVHIEFASHLRRTNTGRCIEVIPKTRSIKETPNGESVVGDSVDPLLLRVAEKSAVEVRVRVLRQFHLKFEIGKIIPAKLRALLLGTCEKIQSSMEIGSRLGERNPTTVETPDTVRFDHRCRSRVRICPQICVRRPATPSQLGYRNPTRKWSFR